MIKGVIFDLDGVIVTTDNLHYLAWKVIADKEGIYFDRKINNRLRGVSRMDSLDIILEKLRQRQLNRYYFLVFISKGNVTRNTDLGLKRY